jgi:hypothetical protein
MIDNKKMNTLANVEHDKIKIYTIGWIIFSTCIGGPLAGCYLISENFKNFGNKDLARKILIIGIISTILLFGSIAYLIVENIMVEFPNSLIPVIYTTIIYVYLKIYQEKSIVKHIEKGGLKYSGWKSTGIGIMSFIVTSFILFFVLILVLVLLS